MSFLIPDVCRTLILDMGDLMPLLEDISNLSVERGIYTLDSLTPRNAVAENEDGSRLTVYSFREFMSSTYTILLDSDTEEVLYDKNSKFNQDIFDMEVYSKVLYNMLCNILDFKLHEHLPRSVVIPDHKHYVFDVEFIYDYDIFDIMVEDNDLSGETLSELIRVILDFIDNSLLIKHLKTRDNMYETMFYKGDIVIRDYGNAYKFRYNELKMDVGDKSGETNDEEDNLHDNIQPIINT